MNTELRLLLACCPPATAQERQAAIRQLLSDGVDWTLFARNAISHGLTSCAAESLARVAPDHLPGDILEAFRAIIDETAQRNRALFDELDRLVVTLATNGIEVISLAGPVLAIRAHGGVGHRDLGKLRFLVRESDIVATVGALSMLGYQRDAEFDRNQRLGEHVTLFGKAGGTPVELRTRLTATTMEFDIDDPALWRRARRKEIDGRTLLTLAAEDDLLFLALHGGGRMWGRLRWVCDVAACILSQPELDWGFAIESARAQGCRRVLLLATALARTYLHAPIPDATVRAGLADPIIGQMLRRIAERWQSEEPIPARGDNAPSMDRLRLHDGIRRQARYLLRTTFAMRSNHAATSMQDTITHERRTLKSSHPYRRMRDGLDRLSYAFAGSDLMLAVIPASAEIKVAVKRYQCARADAEQALARDPDDASIWRDLGDALCGLRRYRKAIVCYDKALSFVGHDSSIWQRRMAALRALGARADIPAPPPDSTDANEWAIQAERLFGAKRFAEAIEASDRALALDPDNIDAARVGIPARLCACDWQRREADERRVAAEIKAGRPILTPFWHRAISDSEADSHVLAKLFGKGLMRRSTPLWRGERYRHRKIRLAYSSTDFRDHVVASGNVGCFEHHDRSRFETTAISLGPDDGSAMRRRMVAAFDRFIDIQAISNLAVARLVRELEIDILVDLNGYSGDRRTNIFAHRPAPVQATFQGYSGTMGLPFFDYIIADPIVIPAEHRVHYSEQVVYLPHTYMPQDRTQAIAAGAPTRTEAGLPTTGFVFACHNNDYKLGPELFDTWMRLLKTVEGSVLWLKSLNPWAMINLRREASARGVAPERLIFAPRLSRAEDHLARLGLADLFLDTRPYNAHGTACDALWVGVPVLTCPGNTFPSRVAASLLHAIGLPELVAASLAEYESLAAALAHDPERLARIKAKLARNRNTEPLFDTVRFTRNLEAAYTAMWNRQQDGLPPAGFAVEQVSVCAT